ncbi:MAG: EF-hand domain-containing protein [Betaproteobacteria bacterium]
MIKTLDKCMIAVAGTLLAFGTAYAQTTSPTQPTQTGAQPQLQKGFSGEHRSGTWDTSGFDRLDANHDGVISREEAQADPSVRDAWGRLDRRNAGKVSREDFMKYGASQPQGSPFNRDGAAPGTMPRQ